MYEVLFATFSYFDILDVMGEKFKNAEYHRKSVFHCKNVFNGNFRSTTLKIESQLEKCIFVRAFSIYYIPTKGSNFLQME